MSREEEMKKMMLLQLIAEKRMVAGREMKVRRKEKDGNGEVMMVLCKTRKRRR